MTRASARARGGRAASAAPLGDDATSLGSGLETDAFATLEPVEEPTTLDDEDGFTVLAPPPNDLPLVGSLPTPAEPVLTNVNPEPTRGRPLARTPTSSPTRSAGPDGARTPGRTPRRNTGKRPRLAPPTPEAGPSRLPDLGEHSSLASSGNPGTAIPTADPSVDVAQAFAIYSSFPPATQAIFRHLQGNLLAALSTGVTPPTASVPPSSTVPSSDPATPSTSSATLPTLPSSTPPPSTLHVSPPAPAAAALPVSACLSFRAACACPLAYHLALRWDPRPNACFYRCPAPAGSTFACISPYVLLHVF